MPNSELAPFRGELSAVSSLQSCVGVLRLKLCGVALTGIDWCAVRMYRAAMVTPVLAASSSVAALMLRWLRVCGRAGPSSVGQALFRACEGMRPALACSAVAVLLLACGVVSGMNPLKEIAQCHLCEVCACV